MNRRPKNPKLRWGFDYNDLKPFLNEAKDQQYPWNWIGLRIKNLMTKSFLNNHYFRFQKPNNEQKYMVSSAIQWICKAEIFKDSPKKILYRRIKRSNTSKLLTARTLKIMLHKYYSNTDYSNF